MHFKVQEKNDWRTFRHSSWHYPWKFQRLNGVLGVVIGMLLLAVDALLLILALKLGEAYVWVGVAALFLAGIASILRRTVQACSKQESFDRLYGKNSCTVYDFEDDKLIITTGNSVTTYQYSDFEALTEDKEYFILWLSSKCVYLIPKRGFTEGDVADFAEFVSPRLSDKRSKPPADFWPVFGTVMSAICILLMLWGGYWLVYLLSILN